jgi:hypothetical protein
MAMISQLGGADVGSPEGDPMEIDPDVLDGPTLPVLGECHDDDT